MKSIRTLAATGLLAVALLGSFTAGAQEAVKVAYVAPLSGPNALAFEEWLKIFRAASEAANAREAAGAGRRIEIVPFDNKGTVQDSLLVFQQALDQNIVYIASTISSVAGALSEAVLKHAMHRRACVHRSRGRIACAPAPGEVAPGRPPRASGNAAC